MTQLTEEQLGGILVLAWYAIVNIGTAACLKRAGQPVFKAFIPVINSVEVCRLAGLSGAWVLTLFVPILNLFAPLYVAMRLARRLGHSEFSGVVIWMSGFTLLPVLVLKLSNYQPQPDAAPEVENGNASHTRSPYATPRSRVTPLTPTDTRHRSSRIRMITLSYFYRFGLVCIPGLMIVGTMAFCGASPGQIDDAGLIVALFCLTPISLLIALNGGWMLHAQRQYGRVVACCITASEWTSGLRKFYLGTFIARPVESCSSALSLSTMLTPVSSTC